MYRRLKIKLLLLFCLILFLSGWFSICSKDEIIPDITVCLLYRNSNSATKYQAWRIPMEIPPQFFNSSNADGTGGLE